MGSGEGRQWQALPLPVQCEETATRTQDLTVTDGKTLPLAPGPPFKTWLLKGDQNTEYFHKYSHLIVKIIYFVTKDWNGVTIVNNVQVPNKSNKSKELFSFYV